MKLLLTNTNSKGQVVIPKQIRDELNITEETVLAIKKVGKNVLIQPMSKYLQTPNRTIYLKLLKSSKPAWSDEDYEKYLERRESDQQRTDYLRNAW